MRPQSNFGDFQNTGRKDLNMGGALMIGKVTKVHHKWHTADVTIIDTGDVIAGSDSTEGKYACRILERNAGFDEELQVTYGDITPIQKGQFVLVGFLRNLKAQPVILGTFHSLDVDLNLLPKDYPVTGEDTKYERLSVTRTQDYKWISGFGEFELSHHSKSFIAGSMKDLDDSREGFEHHDLHVKDKNGKTVGLDDNYFTPLDVLMVLRDKFDDVASGFLKLWVSAKRGVFRISKDSRNNKLTYIELQENNTFKIKQQLDNYVRDMSKNYSEIVVDGEGKIEINRVNGDVNKRTTINIGKNGEVTILTPEDVTINSDKNISINSQGNMSLSADRLSIHVREGDE